MNITDRERVYHKSKSRKWGRKDLLAGLTGDVARLLAQNGRILASSFSVQDRGFRFLHLARVPAAKVQQAQIESTRHKAINPSSEHQIDKLRVLTLNVFGHFADWTASKWAIQCSE